MQRFFYVYQVLCCFIFTMNFSSIFNQQLCKFCFLFLFHFPFLIIVLIIFIHKYFLHIVLSRNISSGLNWIIYLFFNQFIFLMAFWMYSETIIFILVNILCFSLLSTFITKISCYNKFPCIAADISLVV